MLYKSKYGIIQDRKFKGIWGRAVAVTSESVSYPALQHWLVQNMGATAVAESSLHCRLKPLKSNASILSLRQFMK
jgi:hypothetical protein